MITDTNYIRKAIIMAITEEGGIGPRFFQELLMRLGAPEDFQSAQISDFEDMPAFSGVKIGKFLRSLDNVELYKNRIDEYQELGIKISSYFDSDYPALLREINDPPPVIYCRGDISAFENRFIAVVGTTKPTQEGIRFAVDLAKNLVEKGYGIISGLAIGIDSAAHMGALKTNGRNIAVLGCGFFNIYPKENEQLSKSIMENGLLIAEHDPYKTVSKPGLVLRNRLISALSDAVIVVEIGDQTRGELRTANYATKQAKPLFYGNPHGRLNVNMIEDSPGVIINDCHGIDEILKYIV